MSETRTSEHFHGQDEYHRHYFNDLEAPAPLKVDRVDPNLPDLETEKVVDPEMPSAPTKSGREDSEDKVTEAKAAEEPKPEKTTTSKARPAAGSTK